MTLWNCDPVEPTLICPRVSSRGAWGFLMTKYCSRAFAVTALILAAGSHVPNPALAQNPSDFMQMFGGVVQQATRQAAQIEWRRLPPPEVACLDQSLRRQGGSVNDLVNRGVLPSDPRLSQLRASCRGQAVQGPQPATAQPLPYVVEGLALGARVQFESDAYRRYQCAPSEKFPGFTWCHKEETKREGRNEITSSNSILHTPDGTAWYINRYTEPAFFGPTAVRDEIGRLSAKFGPPLEHHIPQRAGLPDAVIAVWGKIRLELLDASETSTVASGGTVKGLLVSFLGDLQRSAKAGVPVYRLGGGAGFLWAATFNQNGQGVLRFLAADVSQITPPIVETRNAAPQPPAASDVGSSQVTIPGPPASLLQPGTEGAAASPLPRPPQAAPQQAPAVVAQSINDLPPGAAVKIAIGTPSGNYLTAVKGGGIQGPNSVRTDATAVGERETFTLFSLGLGQYAIETANGHYLTAVFGGGVGGTVLGQFPTAGRADSIHTDASQIGGWGRFALVDQVGGRYAIRTMKGTFLTAVNGGGIAGPGALRTDARRIEEWEQFTFQHVGAVAEASSSLKAGTEAGQGSAQAEAEAEREKARAQEANEEADKSKAQQAKAEADRARTEAAERAAEAETQRKAAEAEQWRQTLILISAVFLIVSLASVVTVLFVRSRKRPKPLIGSVVVSPPLSLGAFKKQEAKAAAIKTTVNKVAVNTAAAEEAATERTAAEGVAAERALPEKAVNIKEAAAKTTTGFAKTANGELTDQVGVADKSASGAANVVNQLAKFAEVRDNGILANEEFKEIKANLIGLAPEELSLNDSINQWRSLRDKGGLTEEEFQLKVMASLTKRMKRSQ
jgi:hypothetical protein